MSRYATDYTIDELMAVVISRNVKDGEKGLTGMATGGRTGVLAVGIPIVGMGLAQLTHAPNAVIMYGGYIINPKLEEITSLFETGHGTAYWQADAKIHTEHLFSIACNGEIDFGFSSGAQIDKFGNLNITSIGADYFHPKVRLVGNIFQTEHYTLHKREIQVMDHERRSFVEKVDFITAPGYLDGVGAREKVGLKHGGPCMCVTNLAVLGYDEVTKRMKLQSVHPGISIEKVKENTVFELIIPGEVPETEPPTVDEMQLIRCKIDPQCYLIPR